MPQLLRHTQSMNVSLRKKSKSDAGKASFSRSAIQEWQCVFRVFSYAPIEKTDELCYNRQVILTFDISSWPNTLYSAVHANIATRVKIGRILLPIADQNRPYRLCCAMFHANAVKAGIFAEAGNNKSKPPAESVVCTTPSRR